MDPASPTLVRPDVPARLWVEQPQVAIYMAEHSHQRLNDSLDTMPLVAGGVGVALLAMIGTQSGRRMILSMIPGPIGLALRALSPLFPDIPDPRQQKQPPAMEQK